MEKDYYIPIKDEDVKVTEEVYYAYKRPEWRERKRRIVRADKERSLERFFANGFDIASDQISVEDIVEYKMLCEALYAALEELPDDERELIDTLFFQGRTERDVSNENNTPQTTINYRKNNILSALKNKLIIFK